MYRVSLIVDYSNFPIEQCGLFAKEVNVYMDLMPALRKLDKGILIPKTPYASIKDGVLFMENLKKTGNFGIKDRTSEPD